MFKRLLLALAMIAALAGCNTPAGSAAPTTNVSSPATSPAASDSVPESMEPSEEPSMGASPSPS